MLVSQPPPLTALFQKGCIAPPLPRNLRGAIDLTGLPPPNPQSPAEAAQAVAKAYGSGVR